MAFVEGFVTAIPVAARATFLDHAKGAVRVFRQFGAGRIVDAWGADVPKGKVTDFYGSVKARDDETVIFSWVEWPDKATREAGQERLSAEMKAHMEDTPKPFDAVRVIVGSFEIINDAQG